MGCWNSSVFRHGHKADEKLEQGAVQAVKSGEGE